MGKVGFDNDKYLEEQKKYILERMSKVEGKLYRKTTVVEVTKTLKQLANQFL